MKKLVNLLVFILIGTACAGIEVEASTNRTAVVSGKIKNEDGSAVSDVSIQICESKAGFLVMREKVLFSVKVNADGTFKTPPLRHRSSWSLIVRVDWEGDGLEHRSVSFDEHDLDRSRRYASGHVYLETSLRKRQKLRK